MDYFHNKFPLHIPIEAVVLAIDPEQQRISLGIKQLLSDPWESIDNIFSLGKLVNGTVRKIANFGAFVRLENDIDGLIHISQISESRVDKVKDYIKVGDNVDARIIKIDKQERRIGLSLKPPKESDVELDSGSEDRARPQKDLNPGEQMVDVGDVLDNAVEASDNDKGGKDSNNT